MRTRTLAILSLIALSLTAADTYGLTKDERHTFYTTTAGTWSIPYDWFVNLETQGSTGSPVILFRHTLASYQMIALNPDDPLDTMKDPVFNPDGVLPVGFIRSAGTPDPIPLPPGTPGGRLLTGIHYFGQSCASCHTGQLTYNSKSGVRRIRIDGGEGMLDIARFGREMIGALGATLQDQDKLNRFKDRLKENTPSDLPELAAAIKAVLGYFDSVNPFPHPDKKHFENINTLLWGPSRGDAFGRGGNTTVGSLIDNGKCEQYQEDPNRLKNFKKRCEDYGNANRVPVNAPVSNPHIWNAWKYNRVEWNGSISDPLGRNLAQAITTSRRMFFMNPEDPFASIPPISLKDLDTIETVAGKLTPPIWPAVFGPIDQAKALNGKKLYITYCAGCHMPVPLPPQERKFSQDYDMTKKSLVPVDKIGTDPDMANKFFNRPTRTDKIKSVPGWNKEQGDIRTVMAYLTTSLIKRAIDKGEVSDPAEASEHMAYNEWYSQLAYIARSNAGIWATPPFLHNGSVPNLYQLLSPREERAVCFYVGNFSFDPIHVGYALKTCDPASVRAPTDFYDTDGFKFVTALPGNTNTGHEFRGAANTSKCELARQENGKDGVIGCELSKADRLAIIEYLKTCDLDLPAILDTGDQKSMARDWGTRPPKICTAEGPY